MTLIITSTSYTYPGQFPKSRMSTLISKELKIKLRDKDKTILYVNVFYIQLDRIKKVEGG